MREKRSTGPKEKQTKLSRSLKTIAALGSGIILFSLTSVFSKPEIENQDVASRDINDQTLSQPQSKEDARQLASQVSPSSRRGETSNHQTPPSDEDVPIAALQKDPYQDKPILFQRETKPDPNGNFTRLTVVRTTSKYPLVRIDEKMNKNYSTQEEHAVSRVAMVADHVMVRLDPRYSESDFQTHLKKMGFEIRRAVPNSQVYLVKFESQDVDSLDKALAKLKESPLVEDLGPDYIVRAN